jgi:hypothetical protein
VALLSFPVAPANGDLYPIVPVIGQYQYRWSSADATWRLQGYATGVTAGTYGDATNVGQFRVTATGLIEFAQNIPIPTASTTQAGLVALVDDTATIDPTKALSAAQGYNLQTQIGDVTTLIPAFPNVVDAVNALAAPTGVTAGTYGGVTAIPRITVDTQGRVTFAQDIPISTGGTVTSITAGTGLTGGVITTSGTVALDTAYTDTLYLGLVGGTMTGDITFSGTQTFPNVLELAGGTMTGDITFAATQTFPAQDLQTVTTAGATSTNAVDVAGLTAAGLAYPLADSLSGDVLTTDGAGTLGWVTPTVYDLQNVTDNGATTTNAVDVAGLTAAGLSYPLADGAADQVVATDGAGTLGWLTTLKVVAAPTAWTDTGNPNEVAYDSGYFYWYDGTNWQRSVADATPW